MSQLRSRVTAGFLVLAAATLALAIPAVAFAVAPVTTISYSPAAPDGMNGWWVTAPSVYLTSNQDGEIAYRINGGTEQTVAVTADVAISAGLMDQGVNTVTAHATNLSAEVESPGGSWTVPVDLEAPSRPGSFTVTASAAGNVLAWTRSTDIPSGFHHYVVYRSTDGPSFSYLDEIGSTGLLLFSDAPLTPADVVASVNASGVAVVSWTPTRFGAASQAAYRVYRSDAGGPFALLAEIIAPGSSWEDPAGAAATPPVLYRVTTLDGVGAESPPTAEAELGVDAIAPTGGAVLVARPAFVSAGPPARFALTGSAGGTQTATWPSTACWYSVSGVDVAGNASALSEIRSVADRTPLSAYRYETRFGPQITVGPFATMTAAPGIVLDASQDATLWYFQRRALDRAGNAGPWSPVRAARCVPTPRAGALSRYDTAIAASRAGFDHADTVVIASGLAYPDALAASALAGVVGGPILLVGPGPARPALAAELARLGTRDAYVVGGPAAVTEQTRASIDALLPGVARRVAGLNRYQTASRVARLVRLLRGVTPERAFIVSGVSFADALSVSSAAYASQSPILFANSAWVPPTTMNALRDLRIPRTVIVGGTAVVTAGAERVLPAPIRIAGPNRYATSRAFAWWGIRANVLGTTAPTVAAGNVFYDGLVAGPLAGSRRSVSLLTDNIDAPTCARWLAGRRSLLKRVTIVGNGYQLSETTRRRVWTAVSVP